ncbi:probable receptor-like protein kinase at5g39020 [Phtheirospermum japonicum]|uniref:Probable receptor-like protein kinase at5g39020 n=1 Tax=Phtheirospermum japonicum TaxID=374723 RepID=A0A830BMM8_9LAMI|nr:probable receptor-like protein kinase at5g39020 [Phtheirospermum japonicum]
MSVFLVLIFFSLFFPVLGVEETGDCKPTRCSEYGPTIQFPFRDKYLHPEYCGYPSFDVFCNEKKETVLVLPFSVQTPYLNLSSSPFHFVVGDEEYKFTLFNCSDAALQRSNHFVYVYSYTYMSFLPLTSCMKIHEIPLFPWVRYEDMYLPPRDRFVDLYLTLNWTEPACGDCKFQEKRCRLNDSTTGHQVFPCVVDEPGILFAALGSCLAVTILASLVFLCISIIAESADKKNNMKIEKFLEDQRALKPTRFSYSDLRRITLKFSEKLGEGGYGIVYKGKLSNEINVAVKVLHNSKGNGEEFVNEVSTIGRIHHVNVVRLVGFCADGFRRALVYEFLPNDSLEKFIFPSPGSKKRSLGWQKLRDIALGIAKGIEYLHEGCDRQILHFDIKPHNILLDQNYNPKICDFGLAKLCAKEQSGVTMTAARGTMGYIAPEVLSRIFGRVSHKSDVYSFGMLLLEMVGGRKNIDPNYVNTSQVYFPQWIYNHLDLNFGDDFWARIEEGEDGIIARRLTIVGLWCIQWCPSDRPPMKDAIQMLEGPEESLTIPPNPFPANNINATNPIAGMIPGRRQFEIELPFIQESESEYFST